MIANTKFVAFTDEAKQMVTVLKYDGTGKASKVGFMNISELELNKYRHYR